MSRITHFPAARYCFVLAIFAVGLLTAANLQAAMLYWNPTAGGNGTWDTSSSLWGTAWSGSPTQPWAASSTDDATFRGGVTGTITVGSGIQVHNIIVGATVGPTGTPPNTDAENPNNYTLTGGNITLSGSSPNIIGVSFSVDTLTINSTITGTNGFFYNNTSGSNGSPPGPDMGHGTCIITSNNSTTLSGTIEISGYSQGAGALRITNSGALGTGIIDINGQNGDAYLSLDGSGGSLTITNPINLHGRSSNQGHQNDSQHINNYAGNNIISSPITFDTGGDDYILQSDAGTLTINGNVNDNDARTGIRTIYLYGAGNGVINGIVKGAVTTDRAINLVKSGTGTWTLSAANTYNGATTVTGGALRLQNSSALGTGASTYSGGSTAVTISGGTDSGRIELDGSVSALNITRPIILQGRTAPAAVHLENVTGSNTLSGDISLATSGNQYVIQSDVGTLTLNTITNNTASTAPGYLTLQGASSGQVGGIIGNASGTTGALNVIKSGNGTWTLSAANTYAGATTITGGTLSLGTAGSIASSSTITVNSGNYLDVSGLSTAFIVGSGSTTQTLSGSGTVLGSVANGVINGSNGVIAPGGDGTVGTLTIQNALTLGSSTSSTLKFDLSSVPTSGNDLLQVNGALSIPGASTFAFNMLNGQLGNGTYKLIGYTGSLSGGLGSIVTFGLGSGGTTRQTFGLSPGTNEIDLNVGGSPANLRWTGGLGSNIWDVVATQNWYNTGTSSADKFYNLDAVTFDNTGSNSPNINISTTVTPGTMTFSNTSAKTYTFTGTGAIGGATTMIVGGGGTVILANTGVNSYSGTTAINSGTLQIGDGGADGSIGTGGITLGGTLIFNQSSNTTTASTNVISGAGTLRKQGTGALTLGAASPSFTGAVAINAGTVVIGTATALGSTSATTALTIANNAALDIDGNVVGTRAVSVQGAGPDGTSGAIISSATGDQQNAFTNVTLTGPTTFGGTGRWDIRGTSASLAGGGYTLTKTGANSVYLVGLGYTNLGAVIINNGNLGLQGSTVVGSSSTLAPITVNSSGTLVAWGISAAIANNVTLNGGTVGTVAADASAVTYSGTVSLTNSGGTLTSISTSNTTFSGQITNATGASGQLTKIGTGTVILTAINNNWSGGTVVTGGYTTTSGTTVTDHPSILQIGDGGADGSLPDIAGTTITLGSVSGSNSYNGTLFINSTNNINLVNTVLTTPTGGSALGNLTVNGSGIVTLGQANSYTGVTQVGANDGAVGFLRVQNSGALGSGTALNISGGSSNGSFQLDGAAAPGGGITIPSSITINLAGRRDQQNLALVPHIQNVSGNNTINSLISCVTYGDEYVIQADAGSTLTLAGDILSNTNNAGDRFIFLQGAGNGTIAGNIRLGNGTGPQTLIKTGSGTWTMSQYQSYTGPTIIKQGTLALGPADNLQSTNIRVMSGATLDLSNYNYALLAAYQILSGGGTVLGNVSDSDLSVISAGDTAAPGTLTFQGASNTVTLAGGETINYKISGVNADLLDIKGNLTLNASTNTTISVLPNKVTTGAVYTVARVGGTLTNGANITVDSSTTRYTFTPSVSLDGKSILLTNTGGSNMSLAWNNNYTTWDLNSTAAWNSSDVFFNADDVSFGNISGVSTPISVTIGAQVLPASVTVNSGNDYTFATTTDTSGCPIGEITGAVGLTKQGTGTLIMNMANDYTGVTSISGGTLRIGSGGTNLYTVQFLDTNMLVKGGNNFTNGDHAVPFNGALGDISGGTVISGGTIASPGGTLDTNGQDLGAEPITVQGVGVGGNGAIVNNSGTAQNYTLRYVTLSGDATFGGTSRWDIRTDNAAVTPASLTGGGFALNKLGANTIYLVNLGGTDLGNININAGSLGLQGTTTLGRTTSGYNTLTVASSATLSLYAIATGNTLAKNLDLKDNSTIYNSGGNAASMNGNTTLEGNATFSLDNNFTLTGIMTGTGSSSGLTKSGSGTLTLAGTQNYAGATTISGGAFQISGSGTIGNVANATTFEVLGGSHIAGSVTGAGSLLVDAGASLTATSVTQNTITIGVGSTLTIAALPGGPSAGLGSISPVPEPSTWAMLMLAAMGLGIYWRRSR